MKRSLYRTTADRAQYLVPRAEHDSSQSENPAYASDGRPLRYLGYRTEPEGEFAVYEGSLDHPERVLRIEQNPILVAEMFQESWDAVAPIGLAITSKGPIMRLQPTSKLYNQFEDAKDRHDLGSQARALSLLLLNRKAWIPVTSLPSELVAADNKPVVPPDEKAPDPQKNEAESSWKWWLLGIAGVVGLIALGSKSKSED